MKARERALNFAPPMSGPPAVHVQQGHEQKSGPQGQQGVYTPSQQGQQQQPPFQSAGLQVQPASYQQQMMCPANSYSTSISTVTPTGDGMHATIPSHQHQHQQQIRRMTILHMHAQQQQQQQNRQLLEMALNMF